MKRLRLFAVASICISMCLTLAGQEGKSRKKRLLAIGMSVGWQHESVSDALATLYQLGNETGLWETYIRTDVELITKRKMTANAKNLDYFDAVFFMTTGELPLTEDQKADLLRFVRDEGKGFLGAHNATDTLYKWPEYGELIGGWFDGHPWKTFMATVIVVDREFPAMRAFAPSFEIMDEIYQTRNFSPSRSRVLMKLDTTKVDMTLKDVRSREIPISWVHQYGKGRVFYSGLGHQPEVWKRDDIRKMWVEAMKYVTGITN